jgi:hypothetical protein
VKKPFDIGKMYNSVMRAWDVRLIVGGFETEADAEAEARVLAEFVDADKAWFRKAETN